MGIRAEPSAATWDETPEIERHGEELPRLSPGVGCDSTAQGDKVNIISLHTMCEYGHIHKYTRSETQPSTNLHMFLGAMSVRIQSDIRTGILRWY